IKPHQRIDGYYLLADATGVENLQARGFALARWRVREWLFGFGDPVPERFSPFAHKAVIFHAFCVWLYRFFLFLGIALLVYHKTTKVLGIVLFVVEIMIFIGKPIAAEMAQWGKRRADMRWNRQSVRSVFLGAAAIGLMFIPISLPFHLPAVAGVGQVTAVHPQAPGRLVEVHVVEGQAVRRGDVLFALEAPSLLHDERQLLKREALLEHRIARTAADQQDRSNLMILQSQLAGIQSEMQSLSERGGQLSIAAQSDGIVRNVQGDLAPGQWVSPTTRLALLVAGGEPQVTGYVAAERLRRVQDQTSGTFVPDQPEFPKIAVSVSRFEVPAEGDARLATLLDVYGGRIVSKPPVDGEPIAPDKPHYRVSTVAVGADEERFEVYRAQEVRGVLRLWPDAESFAVALVRRVAGVLIRESGF
ncbi:MAG: biotin/lipoyl-binding protein, partial [Pseudomonadota bacterium]